MFCRCGGRPDGVQLHLSKIMPIFVLSDRLEFPPPHFARSDGLLAIGGDLSQNRLLLAYRMGIFPWFSENEPILWWSPDPRLILYPRNLRVSKSLHKIIRRRRFRVTMDSAFEHHAKVFKFCAREKNKDPLCRPCRLDGPISAVERKCPAILHLHNCPALHIIAIHETTMI